MMLQPDPTHPPRSARGAASPIRRAEIVTVWGGGFYDVRMVLTRAVKMRVPAVTGLTLAAGDRVLVTDADGDESTPVIIGELPAGAFQ